MHPGKRQGDEKQHEHDLGDQEQLPSTLNEPQQGRVCEIWFESFKFAQFGKLSDDFHKKDDHGCVGQERKQAVVE